MWPQFLNPGDIFNLDPGTTAGIAYLNLFDVIKLLLALLVLFSLVAAVVAAHSTPDGSAWWSILVDWQNTLVDGFNKNVGRIRQMFTWVYSTPTDAQNRMIKSVRDGEDAELQARANNSALPASARQEARVRHEKILGERNKNDNKASAHAWGSLLVFAIALFAMPYIILGSYDLRLITIREFVTGSANLAGLEIPLPGGSVYEFETDSVLSTMFVLVELVAGVGLALCYEKLRQIASEGALASDSMKVWQWIFRLLIGIAVVLILLESAVGFFRGQFETGGGTVQTIWFVIMGGIVPLFTMIASFILKITFKDVMWAFKRGSRIGVVAVGVALMVPVIIMHSTYVALATLGLMFTFIWLLLWYKGFGVMAGAWKTSSERFAAWNTDRKARAAEAKIAKDEERRIRLADAEVRSAALRSAELAERAAEDRLRTELGSSTDHGFDRPTGVPGEDDRDEDSSSGHGFVPPRTPEAK